MSLNLPCFVDGTTECRTPDTCATEGCPRYPSLGSYDLVAAKSTLHQNATSGWRELTASCAHPDLTGACCGQGQAACAYGLFDVPAV
jgi:hypothetical protein